MDEFQNGIIKKENEKRNLKFHLDKIERDIAKLNALAKYMNPSANAPLLRSGPTRRIVIGFILEGDVKKQRRTREYTWTIYVESCDILVYERYMQKNRMSSVDDYPEYIRSMTNPKVKCEFELDFYIEKICFDLDPTVFPEHNDVVIRSAPYHFTRTSTRDCPIIVTIYFRNGRNPISFDYTVAPSKGKMIEKIIDIDLTYDQQYWKRICLKKVVYQYPIIRDPNLNREDSFPPPTFPMSESKASFQQWNIGQRKLALHAQSKQIQLVLKEKYDLDLSIAEIQRYLLKHKLIPDWRNPRRTSVLRIADPNFVFCKYCGCKHLGNSREHTRCLEFQCQPHHVAPMTLRKWFIQEDRSPSALCSPYTVDIVKRKDPQYNHLLGEVYDGHSLEVDVIRAIARQVGIILPEGTTRRQQFTDLSLYKLLEGFLETLIYNTSKVYKKERENEPKKFQQDKVLTPYHVWQGLRKIEYMEFFENYNLYDDNSLNL